MKGFLKEALKTTHDVIHGVGIAATGYSSFKVLSSPEVQGGLAQYFSNAANPAALAKMFLVCAVTLAASSTYHVGINSRNALFPQNNKN